MKARKMILIALVTALLWVCAAAAETDNGIDAALNGAGIAGPVQLKQWGDTAACFAETDGVKRLVVLENRDGAWRIVIDNPTALIQDADWPELLLDSDNAIFWTYRLSEAEILRYHSARGADGVWGPVDQYYADSGYGDDTHVFSTLWDDAHGGEIIRGFAIMDGNDNMTAGTDLQYFPATWLGDCIRLADFDLGRFPTMIDPQFGARFETDRFFRDAAAALMPEYTYIKGILKDGAMHFLVQKPGGDKVYVICEYASRREVSLIESSPLPEDTYLGVENFTDCLWINRRSVAIRLLCDQKSMSIDYIYNGGNEGGFLFFGDRTVWNDTDTQTILYGDHPWNDLTRADWNTLPRNIDEAAERMDSGRYAMVVNPKPADRLHLRERADRDSRSQGKYYTGTPVTVSAEEDNWTLVVFGSPQSWRRGYMMKQYLTFGRSGEPLRLDISAMPQMMSRTEMLKVYAEPQTGMYTFHYGDNMKIIGIIGNEWYHVWFPATGEYGFVRQNDLWEGNG